MNKGTTMKEIVLLLLIMIFLAGCIPGDSKHTPIKPAGFFWGIWHGWIAPISLIVQIFNNNIRVYERNNSGWWYDFGFYIAILGGFGGLSLTRKRKRKQ